jgi:hypothetical protein
LYFRLPRAATAADALTLSFASVDGEAIISYTRKPTAEDLKDAKPLKEQDLRLLPGAAGLNRFAWDGRYPAAARFDGLVLWGDENLPGPRVVPGRYRATLSFAGESQTQEFEILPDPRITTTAEQYAAQLKAAREVSAQLSAVHQRVGKLLELEKALTALAPRIKDQPPLVSAVDTLEKQRAAATEALYQPRLRSEQDPLNFPVRLNNKLSTLLFWISYGDNPPTDAQMALKDELSARAASGIAEADQVLGGGVDALNAQLAGAGLTVLALTQP